MGYIVHHAIIVTGAVDRDLNSAYDVAVGVFGDMVSPKVQSHTNGYVTFVVAPDGSKDGWPDSEAGDKRREHYLEFLSHNHLSLRWCEVQYGDDEGDNRILRTEVSGEETKPESEPTARKMELTGGHWAIVELMGHRRAAGYLTEIEEFGVKLGLLRIPTSETEFRSMRFQGSSIYSLTDVDETEARSLAMHWGVPAIHNFDANRILGRPARPLMPEKDFDDSDPFDDGEEVVPSPYIVSDRPFDQPSEVEPAPAEDGVPLGPSPLLNELQELKVDAEVQTQIRREWGENEDARQ